MQLGDCAMGTRAVHSANRAPAARSPRPSVHTRPSGVTEGPGSLPPELPSPGDQEPDSGTYVRVLGSAMASMAVPSFPLIWMSGFLWNLTRWMSIFLGAYMVNDITGSPFQVQLVGGAFFAPMLAGGVAAGVVADRFDRRHTMLWVLAVLGVVAAFMAGVVLNGDVSIWMLYLFVFAVGVGGVVDLTSRRALIFDVVGEDRVTNALALESLGSSTGNMLGAVAAGAIIAVLNVGAAFVLVAAAYLGAFVLLFMVRTVNVQRTITGGTSVMKEFREGMAYVLHDPAQVSLLGVTVLVNLFFFSFLPLIPVFAEELEVGPFLTGLLGSGLGIGMVLGSLVLASRETQRRGLIYVGGSCLSMVFLVGLALAPWYWVALLALIVAGGGMAGFATMQSALVMVAAGEEMRGRAMGVLSMAIGALPIGMVMLGGVAEAIGPSAGVAVSTLVGLVALVGWNVIRPESLRMR